MFASRIKKYRQWLGVIVMVTDAMLINVAFALSYWMRYELQWFRAVEEANWHPYRVWIPVSLLLTVILLVIYRLDGVYNPSRGVSWSEEWYTIVRSTVTGIFVMSVIFFFYRPRFYSRLLFIYAAFFISILLIISRMVAGMLAAHLRRRGLGVARLLIIGAGEMGRTLMSALIAQPELGYEVVGFLDDDLEKRVTDIGRFKALGGTSNLQDVIKHYAVDEVIIALPWTTSHRKILGLVGQCDRLGARARMIPDLLQLSLSRVDFNDINGIPLIGAKAPSITGWRLAIKRAIDIAVSLTALIVLSPLFLVTAIAIKIDSPGAVFFGQVRVGRGGREFTLYKFRSMREGAEREQAELAELNEAQGPLFKIRNDPRITRVGRFLRRSSIDELPQLYNVLRGEMSLVGPRPPTPAEVAEYQEWHKKRLTASPGITGLAQVSGRSDLAFDETCLLDIHYIENWSPGLDIKIALQTIPKVLVGTGAY